jgi:hypothetical protein
MKIEFEKKNLANGVTLYLDQGSRWVRGLSTSTFPGPNLLKNANHHTNGNSNQKRRGEWKIWSTKLLLLA